MNQNEIFLTIIYLVLISGAVTAEHFTFGIWWKHNELARRALGIFTVLGLSAPFVFFAGVWQTSAMTYIAICSGFLSAAGTKIFWVLLKTEHERQKRIELEMMVNADSDHF